MCMKLIITNNHIEKRDSTQSIVIIVQIVTIVGGCTEFLKDIRSSNKLLEHCVCFGNCRLRSNLRFRFVI